MMCLPLVLLNQCNSVFKLFALLWELIKLKVIPKVGKHFNAK